MPKGISDLTRVECSKLLAALNDTEDTWLHIRSVPRHKAALISSEEPVIIGAAPPHDSNKSRGKRMFCNLKTDRLGPKRMANKAATRVKKSSAIVGGVEDCDEVDVLESNDGNLFQKNARGTKRNLARVVITSTQPKRKRPSVIEISSDSMSPSASDYKPVEESETKSSNDGIQDLYADSVDTEYEQPSSSRKRKVKATASSRKLKIIAANDSGDEPPPSLTEEARGKQPARPASVARKTRGKKRIPSSRSIVVTSDEEPAPRKALIRETLLSVEPDASSTKNHSELSVGPHNELPSIEQPKQSLSIKPCASSSQATTKEAAKECSKSAPAAEHAIERHETNRTQLLHLTTPSPPIPSADPRDQASRQSAAVEPPSVPDVEISAAPELVQQKVHTQTLPPCSNSGTQNQRPRPRQVCNAADHLQRNDTADAFSLCTRYYPTCTPAVDATNISATSAQLLAAEEGLIGGSQEDRLVPEGSHDAQHPNVPLEVPGSKAIYPPIPCPASYDAANPFARPPQTEDIPDRLPGSGTRPLYAQQPVRSQGDNQVQYDVDNSSGWYTAQQGPFPPIPYISQHYRHTYPLPDPCGPALTSIPQPEHTVHGSHNAPLWNQYHDMYYPGMVSGAEQYRFAYREPACYPFHPPRPLLACPSAVSHPDGNGNPPPGANHLPDALGGGKDTQEDDRI